MAINSDNTLVVPSLKLWAIDVYGNNGKPELTVFVTALTEEAALLKAEKRYPEPFVNGSHGMIAELDHATYRWRERQIETIEVGAWWGDRALSSDEPSLPN